MVEETILFSPLLFYTSVCKCMQVYAKLCLYDTDTDTDTVTVTDTDTVTVTESATQREKENKNI